MPPAALSSISQPSLLESPPRREPVSAPSPSIRGVTLAPPVALGAPLETEYRPRGELDLAATLGILCRGPGDPTFRVAGGCVWLGFRAGGGEVALALRQGADGTVRATAWGAGAGEALAALPALLGARDDWAGLDDRGVGWLREARRRHPGLRLTRTGRVVEQLIPLVLEQKVTAAAAYRAFRTLVWRFGARAPGPCPGLFVPPPPEGWRLIPSWEWHAAGVEPFQSRTVVGLAARASSIERAAHAAGCGDDVERMLCALPGVGPWTANEVRARALGDPDAVSVGDWHLASVVGYAFTGRRDIDDDGMLELLEPWRGHRQRVIRLIVAAGPRKPRRGPRASIPDHRTR